MFSLNSAKNIELLATMETLSMNIEQIASSPKLLLQSKENPYNSAFKQCLESNNCASLTSLVNIALYNLDGEVISNGEGVFYNSEGKICETYNANYCPFKVTSQMKGYCYTSSCSADNIKGFTIHFKITNEANNQRLFHKKTKVFISRLELVNARVVLDCSENELLIGINNDNTAICEENTDIIVTMDCFSK